MRKFVVTLGADRFEIEGSVDLLQVIPLYEHWLASTAPLLQAQLDRLTGRVKTSTDALDATIQTAAPPV